MLCYGVPARASKVGLIEIYNSARDNNHPRQRASSWNCEVLFGHCGTRPGHFTTSGKNHRGFAGTGLRSVVPQGNNIFCGIRWNHVSVLASFSAFPVRARRVGLSSQVKNLRQTE